MQDIPNFLSKLFSAAVQAAHPKTCLAPYLPRERTGKAIVIGAGKAAAAMAQAFEQSWQGPVSGLVVTRYGHGEKCEHIKVIEASHPVPDTAGQDAAREILNLVSNLTPEDQVFFLLSGGGSSLLSLPAPGVGLEQKQAINKALLRSGAAIDEINCVRKHLSAIKGGRLALACQPAKLFTFAISDVPGDDPSVIASGPSVADPTTSAQALSILRKYNIEVADNVAAWLKNPASETAKVADLPIQDTLYQLIATPKQSLGAAAEYARSCGVTPLVLGDNIEGEAREVAKVMAGIAKYIQATDEPVARPCVILSGGETTVSLKGTGRGGRNAEFLLGLANCLQGEPGIYAIAADTDGIDGSEDNAGAVLTPETAAKAHAKGIDMEQMLNNNDGYGFFEALGDLLVTGPTRTNVNDFRAIYIAAPGRGRG